MTLGAPTPTLFGVGMVTSAVVGYLTVKYFIRFLAAHRLDVVRLVPHRAGARDVRLAGRLR